MNKFSTEEYSAVTDEEIVSSIQSGNYDMLSVLVGRYINIINAKVSEYSSIGEFDFEDLVQEGLIALYSATKVFDPSLSSFSTFASLCINRGIYSACRTVYRKKQIPREKLVYIGDDFDASDNKSPESLLIEKEESAILTERIKSMLSPLEYRVLIAFIAFNSYEVIADRLGITVKSVNNAMSRLRRKVKQIY